MTCKNKSIHYGGGSSSSSIGTGVGSSNGSISISIGTTPSTTSSSKNSVPYDEHSNIAAPRTPAPAAASKGGVPKQKQKELRRSRGGRSSSLSGQRTRTARTTELSTLTSSSKKKKKKASTGGQAGTTTRRGGRPQRYPPPSKKVRPKSSLRRRSTTEQRPASAMSAGAAVAAAAAASAASAMSKLSLSSNSIIAGLTSDSRSRISSSSVTGSSSSSTSSTTSSSSSSLEEQQRLIVKQCPLPPSKTVQFEMTTPPLHSKTRRHQSGKTSNSSSSRSHNKSRSNNGRIRNEKTLMLHPDQLILVEQERRKQQQKPMIMIQNLEEFFNVVDDTSSKIMEQNGSGIGAVGGSSSYENEYGMGNNENEKNDVDQEQQWYRQKEYEYERELLAKQGRRRGQKEEGTEQRIEKDCYDQYHDDATNLDLLDTAMGEDLRNMTYGFDDDDVDDRGCRAINQLDLLENRLRCGIGRIGGGRRGGILKNSNKSVTFDDAIVIVSDYHMNDIDFGAQQDIRTAPQNQYNCSPTATLPAEPDSNSVVLKSTTTAATTNQADNEISSGLEKSEPRLPNHRSFLTAIHEKFLVPIHGNLKNNFAMLLLECGDKNSYLLEEERMIIDNSTSLCTRVGSHTLIRKTMPVTYRDDYDDDVTTESQRESMDENGNRMEKEKTKFYAQSKAEDDTTDKPNEKKKKSQQKSDSLVLPIVQSAQEGIPRRQQEQQRAYDNVDSTPMPTPVHVSTTSLLQEETVEKEKSCRCIPTVPHWLKRRKCNNNEHNDLQIATEDSEPKIDKVLCFIKL